MAETEHKKAPTLIDVARLAGVSPMAVSVVINGAKSTASVSTATRARILEAIDKLQYRPNPFARSLRLKRTGTIGFYSGAGYIDMASPFMREIFDGIAAGLTASGRDLLVHHNVYIDRLDSVTERVLCGKTDGVIVHPTSADAALIQDLRAGALPAVVIAEPDSGLPSVAAEDEAGSRMIARHLLSQGHRKVMYRRCSIVSNSERTRFTAFKSEMEAAGATVVVVQPNGLSDPVTEEEGALLLDPNSGITAVACWRDLSAIRVLRFCLRHGIDIPSRLAIVGFDGLAETLLPPEWTLTTFDADWRAIGVKAAESIGKLLDGEPLPPLATVPGTLVVGRTSQAR